MSDTKDWLDEIFNKPAGKDAFYLEAEIRPKLEAAARRIEQEKLELLESIDKSLFPSGDLITEADKGNEQHQLVMKGVNMYRNRVLHVIAALKKGES